MKIEFLGAAKEVTGSKHLITTNAGKKILLDCGMFQGKGLETDQMNRELGFEPSEIDYLFLSHPHIDHSGLIPYIVKLGFKGTVFCTPATRDLCSIMLADSGKIQEYDIYTFNKKRARQGKDPVEPIYTMEDAQEAMQYFISIPYEKEFFIDRDISIKFTDNGHILGSATVNIKINEEGKDVKIAFTGDIGRYSKRILKDPQPFPQADYIIMETTYGDRLHDPIDLSEQKLLSAVIDTCCKKKGKLIIPSFAIGRAQEIIHALDKLERSGMLPDIDVYVDSPLSLNATNIMRLHTECFNDEMKEYIKTDHDPFGFDRLHYVRSKEESKKLNSINRPMIIISASGMMEAGRVKHHIANNISNKKTTILGVGYCAPSTLGAKILRGDKVVSIFGIQHHVKAEIRTIDSYSAHADYMELLRFLECQDKTKIKNIFLVHGEEQTQINFANTLKENGYERSYIPTKGEAMIL
ncbi:MAG: MBL fold metallo-hydrolase [Bacteroidales bacterium]|nr:MBL fold metallo-hydrolase [Bacteroidales bacterium]MDD4685448.1 MBL fold metallo-hydrolase [Bacteroidales bacterium]